MRVTPNANERILAQQRANRLYEMLGSWDAVAHALAPWLRLSRAAWWEVGRGQKVTAAKCLALEHWPEVPSPVHVPRQRPERASVNMRTDTARRLRQLRDRWHVTIDACIDRLMEQGG